VVVSYLVAALAALLSGLAYTEFVVDQPVAGGAFNMVSGVFGELAWLVPLERCACWGCALGPHHACAVPVWLVRQLVQCVWPAPEFPHCQWCWLTLPTNPPNPDHGDRARRQGAGASPCSPDHVHACGSPT